jgi:3-oxoacyl-[acyl-carrier-protein] synthase-3
VAGCAILGAGSALPERVLWNSEVVRRVDATDDWIVERTGIRARRTVEGSSQATSDLAVGAAQAALTSSNTRAADLDVVMVATCSGDHLTPSTACLVQAAIGARRAAAFDVNAACSGFVYGLWLADRLLASAETSRVLLIGADALTRHVDPHDRNTSILFGDGAGAVVLGPGAGLLAVELGADGSRADDLVIPAGGSRRPVDGEVLHDRQNKLRMNGREVFRAAVESMSSALDAATARAAVRPTDLRWVFAHQANARILRAVAERVNLPLEAFWTNLERYGNTGAASIPIALAEAATAGSLAPGDLLGLTAAGAGLTWGAAVMRWGATA